MVPTPAILNDLIHQGRIPPLVAVLVGNAPGVRGLELPCHPPFAGFLARELLPWVRARYHVTDRPARTILGGSSYGGLAAAFTGLRYPEVFGNVLSQSGSFWWSPEEDPEPGWLIRQFAATERLPLRFSLSVGLMEGIRPTCPDGPSQLSINRHMRDVLLAKGYSVAYREFNGGHDYPCWRALLAACLESLAGPWLT